MIESNDLQFGIKSALISKKILIQFLYNKEFLKSLKLQICMIKNFSKIDSNHTCLAEISLNSALNKHGNYYLQVFLKECKYLEKKVIRHIIDDIEISSEASDEE